MRVMISLSLMLNIVVLLPVWRPYYQRELGLGKLWRSDRWAWGLTFSLLSDRSGLVSALLLVNSDPKMVAALLLVQVVYKLTSPITVGTIANPVVVSNLGIAAFHLVTLALIWQARQ